MSLLLDDPAGAGPAGRLQIKQLDERHRAVLLDLLAADPLVDVAVDVRVRSTRWLGADGAVLFGAFDIAGRLRAAVLDSGCVQPVGGGPAEWDALARHLARRPRRCSSIAGRADAVTAYWAVLESHWGPARAVRARQPLVVLEPGVALPAGDPAVRPLRVAELEPYLRAAVAMFTGELGVSPVRTPAASREYRARAAGLLAAGRSFGIVDAGGVVFKADVGSVSARTCQVQGVWLRPDLRGRGLARPAMAAALAHARAFAPSVSLYVNDYNLPARRLYERLGMTEHAVLSTVLF